MTSTRRLAALLLALAVPGALLVGCGGDAPEEPTSYVLTDLGGDSDAPSPTPTKKPTTKPTSKPTKTGKPTSTPTSKPTTKPTRTPNGAAQGPTRSEVIAQIGAAITPLNSVHLDIGDAAGAARLVLDIGYGSGAVDLVVPGSAGGPQVEVRRVNGTLYVNLNNDDGWERVEAGDPRLVGNTGVLTKVLAFDLLDDLRATFVDGTDFEALGQGDLDGTTVDLYRMSLDSAALNQPSLLLLDGTTGTLTAEIAVAQDGRPVRIDLGTETAGVSSLRFSAWGAPVAVPIPALG